MHDGYTRSDAADWTIACTSKDAILDEIEPLPDNASDYRQSALLYLKQFLAIDAFLMSEADARLGWVAVALFYKTSSVRDLTDAEIVEQLGCTAAQLARSRARFAALIGRIQ